MVYRREDGTEVGPVQLPDATQRWLQGAEWKVGGTYLTYQSHAPAPRGVAPRDPEDGRWHFFLELGYGDVGGKGPLICGHISFSRSLR